MLLSFLKRVFNLEIFFWTSQIQIQVEEQEEIKICLYTQNSAVFS